MPQPKATLLTAVLCSLPLSLQAQTVAPNVPISQATHTAVQNGSWSSSATWGGSLPMTNSKVFIPAGLTVTVDTCVYAASFWIRVEGLLRHATTVDTCLTTETLAPMHGGEYDIGTEAEPIAASVTARLIFKPVSGAAIDHVYDPYELTRGLVSEGRVQMHGQVKTPWLHVATAPSVGATAVEGTAPPIGWMTGDALVLTSSAYSQEETFTLAGLVGSTANLDAPIKNPRAFPAGCTVRCTLQLANLTRNVQVLSSLEGIALRAHVMLMHQGGHRIAWVQFMDLGRTTIKPVTDPLVGEDGVRDASTMPLCGVGENVRGRYALHFHRAGPESALSTVVGVVLMVEKDQGLKGGLVNHSSNVSARDNVLLNFDGAHLVTEEGDEVGDFTHNLTIHSKGSNYALDMQGNDDCTAKNYPLINARRRLDTWHEGVGGWLNGGGVDVVDNVFSQHSSEGLYGVWARPLNFKKPGTYEVQFPVALLRDPSWAPAQAFIPIEQVPFRIVGNTSYGHSADRWAQKTGFELKYSTLTHRFVNQPRSVFKGNFAWNVLTCAVATYVAFVSTEDLGCVQGDKANPRTPAAAVAFLAQGGHHQTYTNVTIVGFQEAIKLGPTDTATNVTWNGKAIH